MAIGEPVSRRVKKESSSRIFDHLGGALASAGESGRLKPALRRPKAKSVERIKPALATSEILIRAKDSSARIGFFPLT
jgi:hypothetical protein